VWKGKQQYSVHDGSLVEECEAKKRPSKRPFTWLYESILIDGDEASPPHDPALFKHISFW
jgi:hypothetical protein